jgi:hypothetical protein
MDDYEKCCYQNIDKISTKYQIFDYIYIYKISNTSSFEINCMSFFDAGSKSPPPLIKHWVGGPLPPAVTNLFSRAFQQLKSIGSGKCDPLENV